jgi:hypothetical protein
MNKLNQLLLGCLVMGVVSGCNQNPYTSSVKPGQRIVVENPANGQVVPKVYSLEGPTKIECVEGESCGAEFIGHVPSPGSAYFLVSGLPKGASFDLATGIFTFTPGYDFVDVGTNPAQSVAEVDMVVTVRSTTDSITNYSVPVTLKVSNKMQATNINLNAIYDLKEGVPFEQIVEVNSLDFPQGPFTLNMLVAPEGALVTPVAGNPKQFKFTYTPDYNVVNFNSTYGTTKNVTVSFNLGSPLGKEIKKDITLTVHDVRQDAIVTTPDKVTLDVDNTMFAIRAEDLNGEDTPKITVSGSVPFGKISSMEMDESTSTNSNPSKIVVVKWDGLNPLQYGTKTPINFEVCVNSTSSSQRRCTQNKVTVTLKKGARHLNLAEMLGGN